MKSDQSSWITVRRECPIAVRLVEGERIRRGERADVNSKRVESARVDQSEERTPRGIETT